MPGMAVSGSVDYRCWPSYSQQGCVLSVHSAREAAFICSSHAQCSSFTLTGQRTWTGESETTLRPPDGRPCLSTQRIHPIVIQQIPQLVAPEMDCAPYFPSSCLVRGLFFNSRIKAQGWGPGRLTPAPRPVSHLTSDPQDYSTDFFRLSCLRLVSVRLTQQTGVVPPSLQRSRPVRFISTAGLHFVPLRSPPGLLQEQLRSTGFR